MAKSKNAKVSVHSRAARRAASPSIDVDKSITSIKAPTDATDYNPKTHAAHDAGISKKTKQKPLTRAQRLRREKGLARADKNLDVLEQKTVKSMAHRRRIDDRRGNWDDFNKKVKEGAQQKTSKSSKAVDQDWEDMSDDEVPAKKSAFAAMQADGDDDAEAVQPDTSIIQNNQDDDIDEVL